MLVLFKSTSLPHCDHGVRGHELPQAQLRNLPRFARYHSNVLPRPFSREVLGVQPNAVSRDTSRSLRGAPSGLDLSNVSFPANPTVLPISSASSAIETSSPHP